MSIQLSDNAGEFEDLCKIKPGYQNCELNLNEKKNPHCGTVEGFAFLNIFVAHLIALTVVSAGCR